MVDTSVTDGGLKAVLTEAKLHPSVVDLITSGVGCQTLADFLDTVTEKNWESELKALYIDACKDTNAQGPLQVARIRQAWKIGTAARNRATATGAEEEADIEKTLEAVDTLELRRLWRVSYPHIVYDEYLTPADNVVARLFREFRRKSHSLIPITRIRSLAFDRRPVLRSRKQITEGVVIETEERKEVAVRDMMEYLWGLRVMAHAWTLVGNYQVEITVEGEQKDTLYCTHADAFSYVDRVVRKCMEHVPRGSGLEWVRHRDEATRATAIMKARGGTSWGVALHSAWQEHRLEWDSSGSAKRERECDESDDQSSPSKRQRATRQEKGTPEKAASKASTAGKQLYGSTLPGNKHICKSWTNGACTKKEKDCPLGRSHVCDVIMAGGKICGSASHRRAGHVE